MIGGPIKHLPRNKSLYQSIIFYYDFECMIKQVQLQWTKSKVKDTENIGLKSYCLHAKNLLNS